VKGQINLFVFYSIHYPKPEKEALLIESMHNYAELMEQQQGIVFVAPYAFTDPERGTLIGIRGRPPHPAERPESCPFR
jgi:hypothetical protein